MNRTLFRIILVLTALAVLLTVCVPAALAETADDIVNILLIGGEDMGSSYFPLLPLVLSFNLTRQSVKVIYFYYETQIFGTAPSGETVSIPMSLLPNLDTGEVVKAFETTYGIPINRYLIYTYDYGKCTRTLEAFDLLAPLTIDVPGEILGTAQHTTINGNMKALAGANKRDYTAVETAGPQQLDAVGYLAYIFAIPESVWSSGDRLTVAMADYNDADTKNRVAIAALRIVIGMKDEDTIAAFMRKFTEGQETDITEDDIALWSAFSLNLDADNPYMSVPGNEGVALQAGDIGSMTGISSYQNQMLTYDNEAFKQKIHAFLYGE